MKELKKTIEELVNNNDYIEISKSFEISSKDKKGKAHRLLIDTNIIDLDRKRNNINVKKKKIDYKPEMFLLMHLLFVLQVTIFLVWAFKELGDSHMIILPITAGIIIFVLSMIIFVPIRSKWEEEIEKNKK